jgi:hypothetical protein
MEMASTSSARRSFPTLRYLAAPFRWFFRSRRRVWTAAAVLLAMIAAPPLWWSLQLVGLPDIGDPFDVKAFRSFTIPDDRNAFLLYGQAADRLKLLDTSNTSPDEKIDPNAPWSQAHAAIRHWAEENRKAMALYRRGTERPDVLGLSGRSGGDPETHKVRSALYLFHKLVLLEASRLEEQGDMAGAWGWYRAALRSSYHLGFRGTIPARIMSQHLHTALRRRSSSWAADPRTTPALIRHALDDVLACGVFTPSESCTLKAEYLDLDRILNNRSNPGQELIVAKLRASVNSPAYQLDPERARAIAGAWRVWRREPERSLRVLRLAIANWLAYYDLPPERRPAPDANVSGPHDFYALGPESPAKARALSPAELDRWLNTTADAQELLRRWDLRAFRMRERANHRALVVLLASELYRRDRGTDPPSDEALVGPYLKELPDDGLGDAGREASPRAGAADGVGVSTGRE